MRPGTNAYDVSFQLLECPNCDAPIRAALDGGQVRCEYCGAALHVSVRPRAQAAAPAGAAAEERIAWLRRELARPDRRNPFDTDENYLPDLADWKGRSWSIRRSFADLLPKLRGLWKRALAEHAAAPDDAGRQFRVYWLADRLALFYEVFAAGAASGELKLISVDNANLKRRAALETALARLAETRFAYVLRCKLSRAAARAGDFASAAEWLAACDPLPDSPDLDSEHRLALASLQIAQGKPELAIETLGPDLDTIPVSGKRNGRKAAAIRAHAFELMGQDARVASFVGEASERFGMREMVNELLIHDAAPRYRGRKKGCFRIGCLIAALVPLPVAGVVALVLWLLAESASGTIQAAGGAAGSWLIRVDECASSGAFAPSSPGAELSSTAYPQYRLRFARATGATVVVGGGLTVALGPGGIAAPAGGQAWSLQLATPAGTTLVDPSACAVFRAAVDWNGVEMNGVDEVDGAIAADCPLPGGGRLVVDARFENCR